MTRDVQDKHIIIAGAGISGLSIARMLQPYCKVTVLEKKDSPGGLIRCRKIDGNLFHLVGGHVFNSKNPEVLNWFWQFFDKEREFRKAGRNAKIYLDGKFIGYPIENHLSQLPAPLVKDIISDLLALIQQRDTQEAPTDFDTFLHERFGATLYDLYFGRYNRKIWNRDLSEIPLDWLADKLPMPDIKQILFSNIHQQPETEMVHASFYYPAEGGSQFIINRLAEGLDIRTGIDIREIAKAGGKLVINNGAFTADQLIYSGDIRKLGSLLALDDQELNDSLASVTDLPANGTTNALCYTDDTTTSWLYLPEEKFRAHRIIYTGNFSPANNATGGRKTCVVEFSGYHDNETVLEELPRLPGKLELIEMNYEPASYIIHEKDTEEKVKQVRAKLSAYPIHLLGRFAEWRYYNMDKCIESAMDLSKKILHAYENS
jgi:protoporphyrinogen oxidase